MAANSTSTYCVIEEAAINELMDDNDDGEYVLMSSKEDVNDLLFSYLTMLARDRLQKILLWPCPQRQL